MAIQRQFEGILQDPSYFIESCIPLTDLVYGGTYASPLFMVAQRQFEGILQDPSYFIESCIPLTGLVYGGTYGRS
jgi:hypothetical protein